MSKNEIDGDVGQFVGGNVIHLNLGAVAAEIARMGQATAVAVQHAPQASAEVHPLPPRSPAPRRKLALLGALLSGLLIGGPTGGAAALYLVVPDDTLDSKRRACKFDGVEYSLGSIVTMTPTLQRECVVAEPGDGTFWRNFEPN